ncbi:helix-turn-helix domain-containing protein [Paenibacillus illinoisensis]|uniref:Helix-turn-helix domain-containing protein n=1 Tax=Paenibacillus illinoisensis TaxID=59845 RepID=A0A2W0C8K1_9BACL|nr:helix-turn-helix domain-containing protein [Paenibacillus illinoisensis]PYY28334.1 Uncharacterized protein PIL02S_03485 [Paenibacillus illinoisensis]
MSNDLNKKELQDKMNNIMSQLMTTDEAAEMWELSSGHIKNLCNKGDVIASKVSNTWLLLRDQPNPKNK